MVMTFRKPKQDIKQLSVKILGTRVTLMLVAKNADQLLHDAVDLIRNYQHQFSANDYQSELMQLNASSGKYPKKVSDELFEVIRLGKQHSLAQNSQLNIAIGPVVKSWKIGFLGSTIPTQDEISKKLRLANPNAICLNPDQSSIFLKQKGMEIDLGALAKGYIADCLKNFFIENESESGLINLGGTVVTFGNHPTHPNGYWKIGIQHPFAPRGQHLLSISLKDKAVVTSGSYERFFTQNNHVFHHIIDRHTGYPVQTSMTSLTAVTDSALAAEIWTSRLYGLDYKIISQTMKKHKDVALLMIDNEGHITATSNMTSYL